MIKIEAVPERLPTHAFGREFNHVPEHVRQDLDSLERERAIYSDQWVEEVGDFRHVRIAFTEEETQEFARRSWAYELFIKADMPHWASEVPNIEADIAKDADTYTATMVDGVSIPPPYHCFAAFLGPHLESLVCGTLDDRRTVIELQGREKLLFDLRRVVASLTPTIRSFNARENGLKPWTVEREDDVRDLLYVMLRPIIFDLAKEEVIPSRAGTHKVVDLASKALKLLIEVKWIGKKGQWKRVVEEIHVDTQTYFRHPACKQLLFVIVDAARDIPDPYLLERELSGKQKIAGKQMDVRTLIVEA